MPTSQKSRSKDTLVQNPGKFGNALANVLSVEGGREVVLGQAWIAAPGRLVTCGHVVERFVNAPSLLIVRFPQSGNKYQIKSIRLHPSYVRQPDQLVKFDAAVLEVILQAPESAALPLPFSYEQEITTNEKLWAIHYPTHLG
ncbi:MAG: serine protease, partial [Candidatus Obscuribacterales bacterium]|nr:serine protease [Candidatus Obscuribacterales bacterium]